jgi:F-type H+-transporting ATPase subunit delta
VARQYALAAYDVAVKNGQVEGMARDLADLAALVDSHHELQAVFETPLITPRKKQALVRALIASAGTLQPETQRLLVMLGERNRLMLLRDIAAAYQERRMQADRVVAADVRTAEPLDDAQKSTLARALGQATGKTVTVTHHVDPTIIGGLVARVGGVIFDASVARQIARLRQRLLNA